VATGAPIGVPERTATDGAGVMVDRTARTPIVVADHLTMPARRTGVGLPGALPDASSGKRPKTAAGAANRPPSGQPDPIARHLGAQTVCAARLLTLWPVV